MPDKHLNLFYTYNRDAELIENNLTRAFIGFLSVVSGEVRNEILSALLKKWDMSTDDSANTEKLDFTNARFALQSNIDPYLTRRSNRQVVLTISTTPLDVSSSAGVRDPEPTDEAENASSPTAVPDAWIYDERGAYCILIEAKVGSYPLSVGQLKAHVRDWFGSKFQTHRVHASLCSITWIDVLKTLRDILSDDIDLATSERALLSHMMEFISYYGYRIFDGFDFSGLCDPPALKLGRFTSPESKALDFKLRQIGSPPDFVLISRSPN